MSRPVSSTLKTTSKAALKNPLRASTMPLLAPAAVSQEADDPGRGAAGPTLEVTAQQLRRMQISEFSAWLRTQTNKHKRPFQEETIRGYAETARALDLWMAEEDIDGDFTACSVDLLNRFFAAYRNSHSQGGANTRQRNLHHLFTWLAFRYDHPDPWTGDMVRYGPVRSRPSTLAEGFIRDLLEVTGGGKATSFVDARDHAMIRMLTEGVRREELAQQQITDLSEDLITRPFVRVVPLKGARDFSEGRLVPLMMRSAQALTDYLRVRRSHRHEAPRAVARQPQPRADDGLGRLPDARPASRGGGLRSAGGAPPYVPAYWHAAESVLAARRLAGLEPANGASADEQARAQIAADIYRGLPNDERAGIASAVATASGPLWLGDPSGPDEHAAAQPAYAPRLVTLLAARGHLTTGSEALSRSQPDHGSEPREAELARRGRPGPVRAERLHGAGSERAARPNGGALQQVPPRPASPTSGRAPVR